MNEREELSKEISFILRHAPFECEMKMDKEGWVSVDAFLNVLHRMEKWYNIYVEDLKMVIEESDKKRHELKDGKIRALYGHSVSTKIVKEIKTPPDILYHGTARRFLKSINKNGLLPQKRQYVHLAQDYETAKSVGMRHDDKPCILLIDATTAYNEGIRFYVGNTTIWLADSIPSKYITMIE